MPCPSAKIRDALGKPREGAHAWRVSLSPRLDVAGADLLLTAGVAVLISAGVAGARRRARRPLSIVGVLVVYVLVLIALMAIAVGVHRALCVDTALNSYLGLAPAGSGARPDN